MLPLLPKYDFGNCLVEPSCILDLPILAKLLGELAVNLSGVEAYLGITMSSMMNMKNSSAVSLFASLKQSRIQRDALKAVAQNVLTCNQDLYFSALLNLHERYDKARNKLLHGVWGYSSDFEDAAIWTSIDSYCLNFIKGHNIFDSELRYTIPTNELKEILSSGLFVVKFVDIEKLNLEIFNLGDAIQDFNFTFLDDSIEASETKYGNLMNHPLLKEEVGRILRKKIPDDKFF